MMHMSCTYSWVPHEGKTIRMTLGGEKNKRKKGVSFVFFHRFVFFQRTLTSGGYHAYSGPPLFAVTPWHLAGAVSRQIPVTKSVKKIEIIVLLETLPVSKPNPTPSGPNDYPLPCVVCRPT